MVAWSASAGEAQESVHRALMRLYLQSGRTTAALNQYRICADALQRFGLAPAQSEVAAQDVRLALVEHLLCVGAEEQRAGQQPRAPWKRAGSACSRRGSWRMP